VGTSERAEANEAIAILVYMSDRLVEFQREVRVFAEEREWQQFQTPKNLAMALAGEVGELLAEFQWLTPDESARVMSDPDAGGRVAAEIGDVMIYLMRLVDVLGVDLVEVARDKLADSAKRYPVESSRGSARKAPPSVRSEVV
jgi:NTP pyrophosphatase (non-canonical NTP hydrolase)